ncbi:DrmB family protein [Streptomyces hokutonensis]|uniref:DrmB family protein n=1 Tax=Streptomyces hokutonensis TaxID=1306990 RepID=UPI0036A49C51
MIIRGAVRRSQFVMPFGPGAMQVLADGTSVITAGLDHWFTPTDRPFDADEFRIDEWRLEQQLGVRALRMPPDYRRPTAYNSSEENLGLVVPVLRFPRWSFCPACRRLSQYGLNQQEHPRCDHCTSPKRKKGPFLSQVPFIALCEHGHVQDFPWKEWVHRSASPTCRRMVLELRSSGGGTLASQMVHCIGCDLKRPLEGITSPARGADGTESSYLTEELEPGTPYMCRGATPWLGRSELDGMPCRNPLRAALRGASNVYYPLVISSIFIPEQMIGGADADPSAMKALDELALQRVRRELHDYEDGDDERAVLQAKAVRRLAGRAKCAYLIEGFGDDVLQKALDVVEGLTNTQPQTQHSQAVSSAASTMELRRREHQLMRESVDSQQLVVRSAGGSYDQQISAFFPRIRLVEKLQETRALWGFNRVYAEQDTKFASRMALLRRDPVDHGDAWLPAYSVLGEGIYLELDPVQLTEWEPTSSARLQNMAQAFHAMAEQRHLEQREISPRFTLIHTLAHLLINQLTYECGYSSASLRERLYVSPDPDGMAGLLIYTAAGDAEGTLGGLVRMGQPGRFEQALRSALSAARWCSSDPVCIDSRGQGPDSCNLAACHSCALLPETACEEFNRFLDRGVVVGTLDQPSLGYFHGLL